MDQLTVEIKQFFIHEIFYSNTEYAFASIETSRKRISDIIEISSKITSDLGYHETATLNKSLVNLKSGEVESESGHELKVKKYT